MKETKKYRLLKDLPDGAIKGDSYKLIGDRYFNERLDALKSPVIEHNAYFKWQVENNPTWFELIPEQSKELHKGSEEDIELKKCQDSPYYFATKYLTVNGRPFRTMMNERQFNEIFFHLDEPPPETLTNTVTDNSDVACLSANDIKKWLEKYFDYPNGISVTQLNELVNQKLKQ